MQERAPPTPPYGDADDALDRPSRSVLVMVYEQAWGLCIAYLGVGLLFEVLRRLGVPSAGSVQEFLDGLPFYAIRQSSLLELYLRASAIGQLSPFWNRVLLSSITVGAILLQATLMAGLVATVWSLERRRRRRRRLP
ncbi:MAG: hypothetical protein HY901_02610 [Deltaproteobacteria bacterium]|nr:hypothetical protein [Deltaproteobacteria bacterium]